MTPADPHAEIRDAVRALCAQFPDSYFRAVDAERGYPEAFVDALTKAGWLAALIPQDYGGSGLGLAEAKALGEGAHKTGLEGAPKAEAEAAKKKLEEVGAKVTLK